MNRILLRLLTAIACLGLVLGLLDTRCARGSPNWLIERG